MASSSHLKPGETGKINAKVYTRGRRGFITKNIKVVTNDPSQPIITLSINATVKIKNETSF